MLLIHMDGIVHQAAQSSDSESWDQNVEFLLYDVKFVSCSLLIKKINPRLDDY